MAPGRKRGAKGANTKSELCLGDLVLAKVKGFPAWPAKISRPEDWKRAPDPKKYFVQFFGTSEIAFVAPADIQAFNGELKNKLSARCKGKTVKYFAEAVEEICEEFERKTLNGAIDESNSQTLASETHSLDPLADETLEVCEHKVLVNLGSGIERCTQRQGEMECQEIKSSSSYDVKTSLSPHVSSGKKNKVLKKSGNLVKDLISSSSPPKDEGSLDIKVEGRFSDGGENEVINGHEPKVMIGSKKKHEDKNSGAALSHQHYGEGLPRKFASVGSSSGTGSLRKDKKAPKEKRHSSVGDDGQMDTEDYLEEHGKIISGKKVKAQYDREKQSFQTHEASCPSKLSKVSDTGDAITKFTAQPRRKIDSRGPVSLDEKLMNIESKRMTSGGNTTCRPVMVPKNATESYSTYEDDATPSKRQRRAIEAMPTSEDRLGSSVSRKSDLMSPKKVRSPVVQLQTKRRAVRLCATDDDELPKTPIHGGFTNKVSVGSSIADSKRKPVMHGDGNGQDQMTSKSSGTSNDRLKEHIHSARASNKALRLTSQEGPIKRAGEISAPRVSPREPQLLDSEKLTSLESNPLSPRRSPQSMIGPRLSAEPQNKPSSKSPGVISQKKAPLGANRGLNILSDRTISSLNQLVSEQNKPSSSVEKRKATPKSDTQFSDSVIAVGNSDEAIILHSERMDVARDGRTSFLIDSKPPDSSVSMKHLIAAAQARKKQAHSQSSFANPLSLLIPDADVLERSPTPATLAFESANTQPDLQGFCPTSPSSDIRQVASHNQYENDEFEERRVSSGHQTTGSSLSGGTEAAVARDAFEGMIETLSRTKESIGRATRLAIDCAKYGIANEVVELLIQKLENEPSYHRRVDLFFLVDSITQCSHTQKGVAGASYIPTVQAALPRLIGAAAPPGTSAQENRRQCHKVLRLWLERKILPESVLRRYIDDIGAVNDDISAGLSLRRPSRAERAIDDPIREMEGMLVDEYGSNATFQLPGLLSSHIFEEEDDEEDFLNLCKEGTNLSPAERTPVANRDVENYTVTPNDRRHCILEDVDGELEMEDVSGHQKDEKSFFTSGSTGLVAFEPNSDGIHVFSSNIHAGWLPSPESTPPLPPGSPPPTPPLPTSPPPSAPPPPPLSSPSPPPPPPPPSLSQQHLFPPPAFCPPPPPGPLPPAGFPPPTVCPSLPGGPPPVLSQQSLPHQPVFMSQQMALPPSTMSTSPTSAYQQPVLPHEVSGKLTGNQHANVVSNPHGSQMDASVRTDVLSQQSSFFAPVGISNGREQIGYTSSRPVEYGPSDAYMITQVSQHRPPYPPGSTPFAQRPLHSEPPSHFAYSNSGHQHQYPPYAVPNFPDGPRRYAPEEQWRMPINEYNADGPQGGWMGGGRSCSGPYPNEAGYYGPPAERPPASAINFQPSGPNGLPPATPIQGDLSVHGVPMVPCRTEMSAINWRPVQ